jgi:hypothetical protein
LLVSLLLHFRVIIKGRDGSCPRQDGKKFHSATQNWTGVKNL